MSRKERENRDAWICYSALQGYSVKIIAKTVKLSTCYVYTILNKNGVYLLEERGTGWKRELSRSVN